MKYVTKAQFRGTYFKHHRANDGWGQDYWDKFFEPEESIPMRYVVQEPESPEHTRMMIVSDYGERVYRMFFMTEEDEERFFDHPGKD